MGLDGWFSSFFKLTEPTDAHDKISKWTLGYTEKKEGNKNHLEPYETAISVFENWFNISNFIWLNFCVLHKLSIQKAKYNVLSKY